MDVTQVIDYFVTSSTIIIAKIAPPNFGLLANRPISGHLRTVDAIKFSESSIYVIIFLFVLRLDMTRGTNGGQINIVHSPFRVR